MADEIQARPESNDPGLWSAWAETASFLSTDDVRAWAELNGYEFLAPSDDEADGEEWVWHDEPDPASDFRGFVPASISDGAEADSLPFTALFVIENGYDVEVGSDWFANLGVCSVYAWQLMEGTDTGQIILPPLDEAAARRWLGAYSRLEAVTDDLYESFAQWFPRFTDWDDDHPLPKHADGPILTYSGYSGFPTNYEDACLDVFKTAGGKFIAAVSVSDVPYLQRTFARLSAIEAIGAEVFRTREDFD